MHAADGVVGAVSVISISDEELRLTTTGVSHDKAVLENKEHVDPSKCEQRFAGEKLRTEDSLSPGETLLLRRFSRIVAYSKQGQANC